MRDDGYTEEEHDQILELIDDLPREFYGDDGDWEVTVRKLADIIDAKEVRLREE
jgi:hypothetical protein